MLNSSAYNYNNNGKGLWASLVKSMELNPSDFLLRNQARVVELIVSQMTVDIALGTELVKGMVQISPGAVLPHIISAFKDVLANKELLRVDLNAYQVHV